MPILAGTERSAVQARGEPIVGGDAQLGALDGLAFGQHKGPAAEPFRHGRILGRITFRKPNPLAAVKTQQ